ncbi:unnamed protein product [Pleuronectes platessa]|uniref:Uncharacterized protein n=1 Tax=Pleuronectes platessa TaxID=8262 RepID=A0A9N7W093_PLEPL|nr:unnamed protein product [Pleuronectes platessa]
MGSGRSHHQQDLRETGTSWDGRVVQGVLSKKVLGLIGCICERERWLVSVFRPCDTSPLVHAVIGSSPPGDLHRISGKMMDGGTDEDVGAIKSELEAPQHILRGRRLHRGCGNPAQSISFPMVADFLLDTGCRCTLEDDQAHFRPEFRPDPGAFLTAGHPVSMINPNNPEVVYKKLVLFTL